MDADRIASISERYIELFENITGLPFEKAPVDNISDRIQKNLDHYFG
jgi:phosphoribosylaminoimidazole-succinocarboxamide synthase